MTTDTCNYSRLCLEVGSQITLFWFGILTLVLCNGILSFLKTDWWAAFYTMNGLTLVLGGSISGVALLLMRKQFHESHHLLVFLSLGGPHLMLGPIVTYLYPDRINHGFVDDVVTTFELMDASWLTVLIILVIIFWHYLLGVITWWKSRNCYFEEQRATRQTLLMAQHNSRQLKEYLGPLSQDTHESHRE